MSNDKVLVTVEKGGVLVLTINRPHVRNAIDLDVAMGIADGLNRLDSEDALLVGVLTGAGGGFSAGMDLKAFARGEVPVVDQRGFAGITQRASRKPLVAAIEGFALAGGLEIALACDLIVAARGSVMGLPEVKRSLIAASGGLLRLPHRIPYHVAMEMCLTGEAVTAERLHEFGLINRVTEPGAALHGALLLAGQIANNGPLAVQATKLIVSELSEWGFEDGTAKQQPILDAVHSSDDAMEGSLAFIEKRSPVWKGR